jgi:hypothetical protein
MRGPTCLGAGRENRLAAPKLTWEGIWVWEGGSTEDALKLDIFPSHVPKMVMPFICEGDGEILESCTKDS